MLPRTISDLSELVGEQSQFASAYEPQQDGTFRLCEPLAKVCDDCERERAELEAHWQAQIAELESAIENERTLHTKEQIEAALYRTLQAAGCRRGMTRAVAMLLATNWTLEVDEAGIHRTTDFGPQTLESAVREWLASDDGEDFRGKPSASAGGGFADAVRRLGDTVH